MERLQQQFEDNGVTLRELTSENLPPVMAEVARSTQVLLNLLGSALHHPPPGDEVTMRVRQEGGEMAFLHVGSGIGISAEDLLHLFERFYRVAISRWRASGGSGIGLTIARYTLEAQGGRIWGESEGL